MGTGLWAGRWATESVGITCPEFAASAATAWLGARHGLRLPAYDCYRGDSSDYPTLSLCQNDAPSVGRGYSALQAVQWLLAQILPRHPSVPSCTLHLVNNEAKLWVRQHSCLCGYASCLIQWYWLRLSQLAKLRGFSPGIWAPGTRTKMIGERSADAALDHFCYSSGPPLWIWGSFL